MKEKSTHYIVCIGLILLLLASLAGCKKDPGNNPGEEEQEDVTVFSLARAPDGESSFRAGTYEDSEKSITSRWLAASQTDSGFTSITPDSLKVAYRYIALIPDTTVQKIGEKGIYGRGRYDAMNAWSTDYISEYESGPMKKLPGFNTSHYPEVMPTEDDMLEFSVYVDDDTPVTKQEVKEGSFVIFDGSNDTPSDVTDDTLAVFDLKDTSFKVDVDDLPPEGVLFTGIAYELVYYEAELSGFGTIRLYYNDYGQCKAGDFMVNEAGESPDKGWQWAYMKHGDGPDSWDGSAVPTVSDGGYDDYDTDTEAEPNPEVEYKGYFPISGTGIAAKNHSSGLIPTFVNLESTGDEWPIVTNPDPKDPFLLNQGKHPESSVACIYWSVSQGIFNTPQGDSQPEPYNHPHIEEIADPGGFGTYNASNPIASTPIKSGGTIKNNDHASIIYYEPDDHLGAGDMSSVLYSSTRRDPATVIDRTTMREMFGVYAYDSGLVSNIYDDTPFVQRWIANAGSGSYTNYFPTLLELSMGRICVVASRRPADPTGRSQQGYVYDPPPSNTPDALEMSIVEVAITLQIDVAFGYGEDCGGRSWGSEATIGASDFEKRFMSFAPKLGTTDYGGWGTDPNGPVPSQRGFYGSRSDEHGLETELSFRQNHFAIDVHNVAYRDVYALPPILDNPSPEEGPFTGETHVSISWNGDEVSVYYTTDGSDPTNNSTLYTDAIPVSSNTIIKAIAYQTGKQFPSMIVEAFYEVSGAQRCSVPVEVQAVPVAAAGKPAFVLLFKDQELDLARSFSPVSCTQVNVDQNKVSASLKEVLAGTYYLLVVVDMDRSDSLTEGDLVYPSTVANQVVNLHSVQVPSTAVVSLSGASYTVPARTLERSLAAD
ncbi:MAG: chitobiase/beta-hexosaminidase C-terminal domain-containing protein [Sphaerochaetaceae bacterium]|nr:chitobiase/beta-hexosaminidase C-terminal domain-containing protein [Sphaerochaetaceae bacterium]